MNEAFLTFNDMLLITDADGTLLTDSKHILDKDKAAIREFREGGGLFTIATGRGVSYARAAAEELELEIPAVIFNGGAVYDFKANRFMWQSTLPQQAREQLLLFKERFPTLGIEILRGEDVYVVSSNPREEEHIAFSFGHVNPIRCSIDEVPADNWIKALFVDEANVIDEVITYAAGLSFSDIRLIRSASNYYELLPSEVNKGRGLHKLLELAGISGRYIVAAGDYLNDLEMLQMADLGVAVGNAEDVIKAQADLIVCDNNSGAVSEIVRWLKDMPISRSGYTRD